MMRHLESVMILVLILSFLVIIPGKAGILGVSSIYIEPGGIEDPSTREWKGSFWVITATTDTKESYMLYKFNQSQSECYGQNEIEDKTIVPTAEIEIRITPKQPYWERQLENKSYLVYPRTYGTYRDFWKQVSKLSEDYVDPLWAEVLQCESDVSWVLHTPFDVTIKKTGASSFTRTETIDTFGGTESKIIDNPADNSEKLMIAELGKLGTGYGQPSVGSVLTFNETIAFTKTDQLVKAIEYGKDRDTGEIIQDENFAFYWFGGGSKYLAYGDTGARDEEVLYWTDDQSCMHALRYGLEPLADNRLLVDRDFPGSYRDDPGGLFAGQKIKPIEASILTNNSNTDPQPGLSLVSYLKNKAKFDTVNLNIWNEGFVITSDYKLQIYLPSGAASSVISMKISTELADSVVYQPLVGFGKCEQIFWESTKAASSVIGNNDTAVLKIRQHSTETSKITVKPSIPTGVLAAVTPLMDSAIVDPNSVHTFQFKVTNLGTQTNQTSAVTFAISNDLGTVTDTTSLEFELIKHQESSPDPQPSPNPQPEPEREQILEGDPMFMWLVAVVVVIAVSLGAYTLYSRRVARKKAQDQ